MRHGGCGVHSQPNNAKPIIAAMSNPDRELQIETGAGRAAEPTVIGDGPGIRSGKLAGRSLYAAIWIIAMPVLLGQCANAMVGLVDKILAGHLAPDLVKPALDGLGLAGYVSWFTSIAMMAIGVGGMAIIARAVGSGDRELAERTLAQCGLLSILWGAVVGAVLWLASPGMARIAHLSPAATADCVSYIRILAAAMPVAAYLLISMSCLQGAGETTRPFLIMVVVNVVNVIASWAYSGVELTIAGVTIPNQIGINANVQGIAFGTVTAQAVGAVLMHALMRHGIRDLRFHLPYVRFDSILFRRIVRIGGPGFLDGMGIWLGQLFAVLWVLGAIVNRSRLDEGMIGAHEIAIQWESFSFLPGYAMGVAAGALAGQYLGAGNPKMARRAIRNCLYIAMAVMGLAGVAFILGGEQLTRLISRDPVHMDLAPKALFIGGFVQVFFAMSMVLRGALSGVGDTRMSMIIGWSSTYGVRVPASWLLGYWLGYGFVGVWIALSGELVVRGLLYLARYLQGGWVKVEV